MWLRRAYSGSRGFLLVSLPRLNATDIFFKIAMHLHDEKRGTGFSKPYETGPFCASPVTISCQDSGQNDWHFIWQFEDQLMGYRLDLFDGLNELWRLKFSERESDIVNGMNVEQTARYQGCQLTADRQLSDTGIPMIMIVFATMPSGKR